MERPRVQHIKALAFVLTLLLFMFGAAQHSPHHLSHLNQAIQCGVCSASTHLTGVTVESVAIEKPALLLEFVPGARVIDPSLAHFTPTQERAPPFIA